MLILACLVIYGMWGIIGFIFILSAVSFAVNSIEYRRKNFRPAKIPNIIKQQRAKAFARESAK